MTSYEEDFIESLKRHIANSGKESSFRLIHLISNNQHLMDFYDSQEIEGSNDFHWAIYADNWMQSIPHEFIEACGHFERDFNFIVDSSVIVCIGVNS